jgi:hypothetical protein
MKNRSWSALIAVVACIGFASPPAVAEVDTAFSFTTVCDNNQEDGLLTRLPACSAGLQMPYRHNGKSLNNSHADVRKAIIVVHGLGGGGYALLDAIDVQIEDDELTDKVWLVGPQFVHGEGDGYLGWSENAEDGYATGRGPIKPTQTQAFGSYDVMDYFVKTIIDQSPGIKDVVIMGFSGGAALVHRYSMGTNIEQYRGADVRFRYVISNASDYIYLNDKRPGTRCESDDQYPYGLATPQSPAPPTPLFMRPLNNKAKLKRYAQKQRLFVVGEDDDSGGSFQCEERAQGAGRTLRAYFHEAHLRSAEVATMLDGISGATNAYFCGVENVAHQGGKMMASSVIKSFWQELNLRNGWSCWDAEVPFDACGCMRLADTID